VHDPDRVAGHRALLRGVGVVWRGRAGQPAPGHRLVQGERGEDPRREPVLLLVVPHGGGAKCAGLRDRHQRQHRAMGGRILRPDDRPERRERAARGDEPRLPGHAQLGDSHGRDPLVQVVP